jgi:predicted ATPase
LHTGPRGDESIEIFTFTVENPIVVTSVDISNFKSIKDLSLPLGSLNVLISSNGAGKSNILEAIAFGGAASADKLDHEFLFTRGVRPSTLVKSAFSEMDNSPINLVFVVDGKSYKYAIEEDVNLPFKWYLPETLKIEKALKRDFENSTDQFFKELAGNPEQLESTLSKLSKDVFKTIYGNVELDRFVIFSPEVNALRKLEDEGQILPLGVRGEGLFNLLQIFYTNYGEATLEEIKEYLHLIEWFDDFEPVSDKVSGRKMLAVKDINMPGTLMNQNSVNEGFLFLLFYISLIVSKETPSFFAIDNIEAALHPRLCEELIRRLAVLAKKYNKQLIITTHNPFILDGLDLNDPEQKLFVVRRNSEGETIADAIKPVKNMKLSEAWMKGRIGSQPETID